MATNPTPANAGYILCEIVGDVGAPRASDAPAPTPTTTTPAPAKGGHAHRVMKFVLSLPREYVVPRMGTDDTYEEEVQNRERLWAEAQHGLCDEAALAEASGLRSGVVHMDDALLLCALVVEFLPVAATTRDRRVPAIDGIMAAVRAIATRPGVPEGEKRDDQQVHLEVAAAATEIHQLLVGSIMDLRQVLGKTMETIAFAWADAWGDVAPIEGRRK